MGIIINDYQGTVEVSKEAYLLRNRKLILSGNIDDEAASVAAVILACGQRGRRFILPHARTMIHEPVLSGSLHQPASSLKNMSESLIKTKEMVNSLLAERIGKTLYEINETTACDYWMAAKESVQFGLCDEVRKSII